MNIFSSPTQNWAKLAVLLWRSTNSLRSRTAKSHWNVNASCVTFTTLTKGLPSSRPNANAFMPISVLCNMSTYCSTIPHPTSLPFGKPSFLLLQWSFYASIANCVLLQRKLPCSALTHKLVVTPLPCSCLFTPMVVLKLHWRM